MPLNIRSCSNLTERSRKVRERILQWIGIACGIGIGPTKTLAKLANFIAKTAERNPGSYSMHLAQVCNLGALSAPELHELMQAADVDEVWGVGRRIGAQLQESSIKTVLDLARVDSATVKRRWSVVLERTVRELQGTACIGLEDQPPAKQEIACTRSFRHSVTELHDFAEAVTEFASRAAEKLRKQGSHAGQVLTFIRTSPYRLQNKQYSRSTVVPLRRHTSDSRVISQAALGSSGHLPAGLPLCQGGRDAAGIGRCQCRAGRPGTGGGQYHPGQCRSLSAYVGAGRGERPLWARYGVIGQCRAGRRAPELVDETGAAHAGLHNPVGGHAGGEGVADSASICIGSVKVKVIDRQEGTPGRECSHWVPSWRRP